MSSISSIGGISYNDYGRFASGKRIQSAADGAAALSIIQKEDTQIRGYKTGTNNIGTAKDMLNISDGALAGITDNLQRIRELGVQAANTAVVTDAERSSIQAEIEQLKKGISDIASQTSFNTKNLLDGSNAEMNIMTDGNGNGMRLENTDATLQALGIADFDVTKNFDLSDIDKALEKVNAGRSLTGAQSNALEYAYRYNTNAMENTTAAKSRLEDLDYPEAISEQKKKETLQEYAFFMQRKMQDDELNRTRTLFA